MAILAQDQVTIADLTDGYSVYLELDTIVFNGSQTASLGGTISCEIKALLSLSVLSQVTVSIYYIG